MSTRNNLVDVPVPGLGERAPAPSPVDEIAQKYRTRLRDLAAAAGMPHSLPAPKEAPKIGSLHALKPALDRHFGPLGYSCKGGSGTFTLQRRTALNQVVEVFLDVGTWSRRVRADFCVHVFPGRRYTFPMPVAPGLDTGTEKYPIGDEERWEKIVANLAVLAGHLDRQIVPEIEAAAGQAPVWFEAPK